MFPFIGPEPSKGYTWMWIIITVSCNGLNIKAKSDVIRKTHELFRFLVRSYPRLIQAQNLDMSTQVKHLRDHVKFSESHRTITPTCWNQRIFPLVHPQFYGLLSRTSVDFTAHCIVCIVVIHISSFITSNNKVFSLQLSHMLNTRKGIVPFLQVQLYQSKPRRPSLHDTVTALWSSEEVLNSSWLKGDFKKQARFRPWISSIQHIQSD